MRARKADIHVAWGKRVASRRKSGSASTPKAVAGVALTFQEQMLAGAIARGVAQTLLHPVDVARTRLQARGVTMQWTPRTFVKGVFPQILLACPAGAIQFAAFEYSKKKLAAISNDPKTREMRMLLAGAAGALSAAVCRVPQEVLKQRIQADVYPNLVVALRETLKTSGPAGLYNGWLATVSRDVPWNALSFMFHSFAKNIFTSVNNRAPKNDENLTLAGVSGALAAVIMTPIDVVKTRLMTQRAGAAVHYSGIVGTFRKIVAEEGASTLMKGVIPRIVFLAPLAGITFSLYEAVAARIKERKTKIARVGNSTSERELLTESRPRIIRNANSINAFVVPPHFSFSKR